MRAALLALAIVLPTQAAEISGRIQYSPEIALDQAQIALVNEAIGVRRVALSNADGYYAIANAQPGIYKLIVRKSGFKTAVRMDIRLEVGELARVDVTMQLGAIEETIVVEAVSSPLDTEDASVKTVVGRDYVENLPVQGRSLLSLLELAGGVLVTPANGTNATTYGAGQFSVYGQRADANYITVDGVSVNGGIAAPFGPQQTASQSPGGTLPAYTAIGSMHDVVSMEALDQFRLDTATTRTEFGRMPGGQLSLNTRFGGNNFHGTLFEYFRNEELGANDWFANRDGVARPPLKYHDFGGALGGPLISNRTFFFLSQEVLRLGQSSASTQQLPSAAVRAQLPTALRGFLVGVPIPDPALVDPYLGTAPSTDMTPQSSWVTATSLRIDHTVTSRLQIFGRYNHAPSWSSATQYFGTQATALDTSAETVTLGADAAVSSTTQASLRFGYLGTAQDMTFRPHGAAANADPGYAELLGTPPAETGYAINLTGFNFPSVANWHSRYSQRQWNLTGSMSATLGRHQMRWGLDWRQVSPRFQTQPYLVGAGYTVAGIPAGQHTTVLEMTLQKLEPAVIRLENEAAFVEDAWKVSGKLTLSYGLRMESNPPPLSPDGKELFGAVVPGPPATVRFGSAGGDLWKDGYRHLAPRFGWAFRPSIQRGLVWRSGAGLFYDLGFGSALQASPFVAAERDVMQETYPGNLPGPSTDSGWIPPQAAPQSIAQDFRSPLTWRWNTTLEQSFARRNAVSVSYVGAAGRHLLRVEDTATSHYMASRGSSGYHALQAQSSLHLAGGFQAMASFVWSHSIDNASIEDYVPGHSGESYVTLPIDRGNSDFDVRLATTVAALYQPKRLNGWSLDAIFRARTGFPIYWSNARPDLLNGSVAWIADTASPTGKRLNPAAFRAAPSGRQGTLGRNVLFGPGMWQLDMALQREFRFESRVALQLRMEAFNLLNHPNFGNPDVYAGDLTSSGFGIPATMLNKFLGSGGPANGLTPALQTGGPRAAQIALRLRF
jgi:hypothetical protein